MIHIEIVLLWFVFLDFFFFSFLCLPRVVLFTLSCFSTLAIPFNPVVLCPFSIYPFFSNFKYVINGSLKGVFHLFHLFFNFHLFFLLLIQSVALRPILPEQKNQTIKPRTEKKYPGKISPNFSFQISLSLSLSPFLFFSFFY